jgi:SAM-dependent methyltransferase
VPATDTPNERTGHGEYVTDVPYTRHFAHQLAPTMLRLVAAMNGVAPPTGEDFVYCELGSGVGDSLVTLAAANPRGEFVGIDVNPEHIAISRRLAEEAGLANVRFLERDFSQLAPEELPSFDFIGAHGFMSWVGPAMRSAVVEFAKGRLKEGGLLYVSYNALPGWAAIEPLRRLILDRGALVGGTSLERAREGYRFARRLADAGAGYFASHPTAKSMLSLIEEAGLPYVVHEYMNAHWEPMYFADMASSMAGGGLQFVGQMPLHLNVPELAVPPALKEMAKTVPDRAAFETFKDYAVNELFRSDVYVKAQVSGASVSRSEKVTREFAQGTPFGTTVGGGVLKRSVKLPSYTLDFTGPIYDGVIGAIGASPASATELAARPELASFGVKRIGDVLMNLALGGEVLPMRALGASAGVSSRYRVPIAFNRAVLADETNERPRVLASPATGTGMTVSPLELLCLQLLTSVEPPKHASWIRAFAHRLKAPLAVGNRTISDPAEVVRVVQREVEAFRGRAGAKLVELGVLEGA